MRKPTEFIICCGPGTVWKCKVIIHANQKALTKARGRSECQAFCWQHSDAKAADTGFNAEMHFNRKNITVALIVHEASHVVVAFSRRCRLDLNARIGDEAFAESMEHVVMATIHHLRKLKIKFRIGK